MKIFFKASDRELKQHSQDYKSVIKILKSFRGVELSHDWLEVQQPIPNGKPLKIIDSSVFYNEEIASIEKSDLCVFATTVTSTSIGHLMSYSIFRQKPTLVISNALYQNASESLYSGLASPFLTVGDYNDTESLTTIIEKFIKNSNSHKKYRINLAISSDQNDYITWAAYNYGQSKTDIIQNAIEDKKSQDKKYTK